MVEFGPRKSKYYSEYYQYHNCVDKDLVTKTEKSLFSYVSKGFTLIKNYIENFFGFNFEKKNDKLGDAPGILGEYGKLSCNHTNIILNKQFFEYLKNLIVSYDNKSINSSQEMNEEGIKKAIFECYPVTCHDNFDSCYDSFVKLVFE